MIRIDRNSKGTVALVVLISAALVFVLFRFIGKWWVEWPAVIFVLLVCGWQILFHRVPDRARAGSGNLVSAVADGKIVFAGRSSETEHFHKELLMVSIYMDFWDVHANFWPVTGKVTYSEYFPGKHFLAFKPKASLENEHTCTTITTAEGKQVFFKQLAGGFARRIVSYAKPGLEVNAGEQCGIIKFGSRIDIWLPLESELMVKVGDEVRAAETVIARI